MENVYDSITHVIGKTPVIRLNNIENYFNIDNEIYIKAEFLNPGGSIKDRIGKYILENAESEGKITKGTVIIEPTSGNTGVGLALMAINKGYKTVFTMPTKVSIEKELLLKALGAFTVRAPTNVAPDAPNSYYKIAEIIRNLIAKRQKFLNDNELSEIVSFVQNLINEEKIDELENILYEKIDNSYFAYIPNQYYNKYNPLTHYEITAREIWDQLNGDIDYLFAGVGTGGTITGISMYLKEISNVKVIGVDPVGSIYNLVKRGIPLEEALKHAHTYLVEGIGEDIIPATVDLELIDDIVVVNDQESFSMTRFLAKKEGILVGGSSGSVLFGALKYLKGNNIKNKKVVLIFPDTGRNYLTKVYNDEWLRKHNLETDDEKILEVLK
ncbi:cysteine synthase family protein [Thermosipho sp. (in: thermotogales)]|jgi:cystathionine beta-synthase|uniref:PLP-dependent cysteine synthase family protein n=1 Tax=Thermosipho sp. (in: thermotogales) TaxID=1968895 RepID=UPI00257A44C4|nr:cysteine synthase family protein [Thermosipho sp. (in: thermotogales)]MBZ4650898.1 cystathionine beta-synthase [Thermosipho sp. (in: thermotogales)]MDK2906252.1 cystathionine beta-synthase [Petrotoga sp.]